MRRLKISLFVLCVPLLSGCYILEKLPEISTMGEYSREKDEQHKLVQHNNANYDALMAAITADHMNQYPDQASILKAFEEPISINVIEVDGKPQEKWLYRHLMPQKAPDRVYLYFDSDHKLVKYEQEKVQW